MTLLLKGLRWRATASIALFLVAVAAILAASAGPIYLQAADESVLRTSVDSAAVFDRGLTLTQQGGSIPSGPPTQGIDGAAAAASQYGLVQWFASGLKTSQVGVVVPSKSDPQGFATSLVARDGACAHVMFVTGRCPTAAYETALSDRSAGALGVKLGDSTGIELSGQAVESPLRITGIYRPIDPRGAYWWGQQFFGFGPGELPAGRGGVAGANRPHLDAFFITQETVDVFPAIAFPFVTEEMPLKVGSFNSHDASRTIAALNAYNLYTLQNFNVTADSRLPTLLQQARDQTDVMALTIGVVELQLILVAVFVLYALVTQACEVREHEVALAKLRGLGPLSVVAVGLMEPALLLLLAVPVGIVLGWLVVRIASSHLLSADAPVTVDPLALAAAGAAFLGGIAATALGSRRMLTRSLATQLRDVGRAASARGSSLALDAVVLTLATVGLIDVLFGGVARGGQANPTAILAPGLLAIAAAVVAIRLLPTICRPAVRWTTGSPFVAVFLALRNVIRRPSALRQIAFISPAVALATFALSGYTIADQNRATRAAFDTGADRVLTVDVAPGVDFVQAVRRADPSGRGAMAVAEHPYSGGTIIAVDATRLTAVTGWPQRTAGQGLPADVSWLQPPTAPPVHVSGSEIRLTVIEPGASNTPRELLVSLLSRDSSPYRIDLGAIVRGEHTYAAALPSSCSNPCRLAALTLESLPPASTSSTSQDVSLVLTSLEASAQPGTQWHAVDAGLDRPERWRSDGPAVRISANPNGASGLVLTVPASDTSLSVMPADLPSPLPAVITPDQVGSNGNPNDTAVVVEGLDGHSLTVDGRADVQALPKIGNGVLVDLTLAQRAQIAPAALDNTHEVWLSGTAARGVLSRLRAEGLTIAGMQTSAQAKARLDHGGPPLAYDFFLFAAGAAVLIALGAVVFGVIVGSRRRVFELALARSLGVPSQALLRAVVGELILVQGTGALIGVAAGLVGVLFVLPSVPEFVDTGVGPPLDFTVPIVQLGGFVLILIVILMCTAALAAARLVGAAVPERLRVTGT